VFPLKDDNPTTRTAWVTIIFIVLNVAVFFGPQGMADPQNTNEISRLSLQQFRAKL
jgi:hypothetical protein